MNYLQAKLYTLLLEVDEICKKNGIIYYLAGGTALGAIRGGGFLPWDDDIDLYITRDNWNKLVKAMEHETPENRVFVCNENTDLYCNPVGRYVDKNTTVMMKSQLLCGKACGQLIEFFIMDPMPKDERENWKHRQYVKVYTELLSPYFVVNRNILSENTDFDYDLYQKFYFKSRILGRKKVLNELLCKITSTNEDECTSYCMRWGTRTLIYAKDILGTPRYVNFENAKLPIPNKQEAVARIAYGDSWMYVPDDSGKIVHNLDKDLDIPFNVYVDLYMPLLNKKKLFKSFRKNKEIRAHALLKKNLYLKKNAEIRSKMDAKYIKNNQYDIQFYQQLLNKKAYDELNNHLSFFYNEQLNTRIGKDGILIPLCDEYIYIAIMNGILQGCYYKVTTILDNRKRLEKPLSQDLKNVDKLIKICREFSIAIYDEKNIQKVKALLEQHSNLSEILIDYARAKLWLLKETAKTDDEYKFILEEVEKQINIFGRDGELIRYEAFALFKLGYKDKAKITYMESVQKTRNGYVWKEAKELMNIDAYKLIDGEESVFCNEEEIEVVEGEEANNE